MNICRHLTYTRSLSPGKAVFFYQTTESDFVPLQLETNKIRAPKSGSTEAYDRNGHPKELSPHALAYSNPQCIQACYVPPNVTSVHCRFSLRVEANSLEPDTCEDLKVRRYLSMLSSLYAQKGGYKELAKRYCRNLLMGTWLWRNKHTLGTKIEVVTSNGSHYEVSDTRQLSWCGEWSEQDSQTLTELVSEMEEALINDDKYWLIDVHAILKTGFCQEIHPSQKFNEHGEGEASKQYATTVCANGKEAVCFHAEKVGAALQLIDDWWSEDAYKPLRAHEYGADRNYLLARRHPARANDFYTLIKYVAVYIRSLRKVSSPVQIHPNIHYVMSILCKGGLYQRGRGNG
ncbi:type I-F CRISPR-associated protein Csy3 [Photobacterium leiognathi]|uniref:type I-F CRISPR-associated protein Csy3 n=1 Tax=Photobacterium leiognathi TaxID=553611 RepID=UPI002981F320|nr:type I-F CRISPR-associated protein Csy3 [Photobacterium leiognathi]